MGTHEENDRQHLPLVLKAMAELQEEKARLQGRVVRLEGSTELKTTFKLVDYQENYNENAVFRSEAFDTHPRGYRMVIRVRLGEEQSDDDDDDDDNGDDDSVGDQISVCVRIENGKYDNTLVWPFRGVVTVTLLNQLEDKCHFSKTVEVELRKSTQLTNKPEHCFKFISRSRLGRDPVKNTQYLKDDTLYFRVEVETEDYKPWLECNSILSEVPGLTVSPPHFPVPSLPSPPQLSTAALPTVLHSSSPHSIPHLQRRHQRRHPHPITD